MLMRSVQDRLEPSFQVDLHLNQDSWYSFSTSYPYVFTQVIIIQLTFLSLVHKAVKITLPDTELKASPDRG